MEKTYIYKNIIGRDAIKLGVEGKYNYTSLKLCNKHLTDSVDVSVYFSYTDFSDFTEDVRNTIHSDNSTYDAYTNTGDYGTTTTYYIIQNLTIPYSVTLVLEEDDLKFDTYKYDLYVKLNMVDSAVDATLCGVEDKTFKAVDPLEEKDRFRSEY